MSKVQMLRAFVNDRLNVAVEEISVVFERTILAYEEEVSRAKAECEFKLRQCELKQRQLDAILRREYELNRTDHLQVLFDEVEEGPFEKELDIPSLHQDDLEPPLIKEEQNERSLEPEEAKVKSEDRDEEPLSPDFSQYQIDENGGTVPLASTSRSTCTSPPPKKTESNGYEISEPDNNLDSSEDVLEETRDWQSDTDSLTLDSNNMQNFSVSTELAALGLCNEPKSTSQAPTSYCCKVCQQCFPNKMALMLHVRTHPCECGLCGQPLQPTETMKLHLQSHKRCSVCGKRFTTISICERHMALHTGERPFSCSDCGKGFTSVPLLQRHKQSHTRPFSCQTCGKRFSQQTSLKTHMRVHTGEKPYACIVCGRRFTESGSLTKHLRVHTGVKPFSCTVCEMRFTESGTLKTHMKIHTINQFSCKAKDCEQMFFDKQTLKQHITEAHSKQKMQSYIFVE